MTSRGELLRLRGALVGATSGVVSLGAHFVGGGSLPDTSTATAVVAACGAVGTGVASIRRDHLNGWLLALLLVGGQAAGHIALTITSEHMHHALPGTTMLVVHALGVLAALLLVRGTEHAVHILANRVLRLLPVFVRPPAPPTVVSVPAYRSPVEYWLLVSAGTGTRGPPRFA